MILFRSPGPRCLLPVLLLVWSQLALGRELLRVLPAGEVHSLAVSEHGSLAVGSDQIQVFDLETGVLEWQLGDPREEVRGLAFLALGDRLLSASEESLILWDLSQGKPLQTIHGDWHGCQAMALSPDEEWVAVAYRDRVELRATAKLDEVRPLGDEFPNILALDFSPDSKLLALGGRLGEVQLIEVSDGAPVHDLIGHDGYVTALAFTPDGLGLVTAGDDRQLLFWDVITGERTHRRSLMHRAWSQAMAVSPEGLLASAGADGLIFLWDLQRLRLRTRLEGHFHYLAAVAFGPTGDWLVSGGKDRTLRIWDLRGLQEP